MIQPLSSPELCSPKTSAPSFDKTVPHVDAPDRFKLSPWNDTRNIAFTVNECSDALAETHCDLNSPLCFELARTSRETGVACGGGHLRRLPLL